MTTLGGMTTQQSCGLKVTGCQ